MTLLDADSVDQVGHLLAKEVAQCCVSLFSACYSLRAIRAMAVAHSLVSGCRTATTITSLLVVNPAGASARNNKAPA